MKTDKPPKPYLSPLERSKFKMAYLYGKRLKLPRKAFKNNTD